MERLGGTGRKVPAYVLMGASALYIISNMLVSVPAPFFDAFHFSVRKYLLVLMAVTILCLCRFRYKRITVIFSVYWLWLLCSRLFLGGVREDMGMLTDNLFYLLLLTVGTALTREQRLMLTDIIASLIAVFTSIGSVLGIWCGITQTEMVTPGGATLVFYFEDKRLELFGEYPTVCALWFLLAIMLMFYLLFRTKRLRPLVWVGLVLNYLALSLTFCRNAQLAFSLFVGGLVLVWLLVSSGKLKKLTAAVRIVALVLAFCAVFAASYKCFSLTQGLLGRTSELVLSARSAVSAPQIEKPAAVYRAEPLVMTVQETKKLTAEIQASGAQGRVFTDDRGFNDAGRWDIYKAGLYSIAKDPKRLLIGCISSENMLYTNQILPEIRSHHHNSFLDVLMISGIPGLLLALVMVVVIGMAAVRLAFSVSAKSSERIMALIPPVILACSVVETLIFYFARVVPLCFYLFSGLVIAAADEIK